MNDTYTIETRGYQTYLYHNNHLCRLFETPTRAINFYKKYIQPHEPQALLEIVDLDNPSKKASLEAFFNLNDYGSVGVVKPPSLKN